MRRVFTAASAILIAGAASAQSMNVDPGLWRATTDVYISGHVDGDPIPDPPEFSEITECWATDDETRVDATMMGDIEGCSIGEVSWSEFGMTAPLICSVEGMETDGYVDFILSHDRTSFAGHMNLSAWNDRATIVTDGILMAHRLDDCPAPN